MSKFKKYFITLELLVHKMADIIDLIKYKISDKFN